MAKKGTKTETKKPAAKKPAKETSPKKAAPKKVAAPKVKKSITEVTAPAEPLKETAPPPSKYYLCEGAVVSKGKKGWLKHEIQNGVVTDTPVEIEDADCTPISTEEYWRRLG